MQKQIDKHTHRIGTGLDWDWGEIFSVIGGFYGVELCGWFFHFASVLCMRGLAWFVIYGLSIVLLGRGEGVLFRMVGTL